MGFVDEALGLVPNWLATVCHPIDNCYRILSIKSPREKELAVLKLVSTSCMISFAVELPLFYTFGLPDNELRLILDTLCQILAVICCGIAILGGLRLYGIKKARVDLTAMYAAYFVCYQPVTSLLYYASDFNMFPKLQAGKRQGLSFAQTFIELWKQSNANPHRLATTDMQALCSWALLVLLSVSSALMAATLCDQFNVPRRKAYTGVTFAIAVAILPILLLQGELRLALTYVFIK